MVKIKTKKKMTLPELIKWGWDNGVGKSFYGSENNEIVFGEAGWVTCGVIRKNETFEVEIEEEITEETEIPTLVEVCSASNGFLKALTTYRTSIKFEESYKSKAFYMLNDDMTMTLLWKEGEMVE